jgi:stage V sporulation protein B
MGINGAAIATTIASLFIMSTLVWKTMQLASISLPVGDFVKIIIASIVMGLVFVPFPQTKAYFILALILSPFIYVGILAVIGGLKIEDVRIMYKLENKLGPFSGIFKKIVDLLERFAV